VGDLAPTHGIQPTADPIVSSYDFPPLGAPNLGGPVQEKAAFNNPPYAYGVVERTFSEWKSSALDDMDVRNFLNLPADLQVISGALNMAYQSAMLAGGTHVDGTVRTFSCQSCHMRPDVGEGCNKNVQTRSDLPKHDQSGGNYWMWPLIRYQDQQGTLRLGGGLTATQIAAMDAGQIRAQDQLRMAASLEVIGDTVKITNLTGHKLITGYPEGRRMWLNIKWYDGTGAFIHEDGAYGRIGATVPNPAGGPDVEVESILDLSGTNTEIYEAHYAMTREWAQTLMSVNAAYYGPIVLSYDRIIGGAEYTIADLAAGAVPHGTYHDTFHFVLNDKVSKDNRIPPYGFDYETARQRNALPVPDTQYRDSAGDPTYDYWDVVDLVPPPGATGADITLYYQGTSWEYIQFLWLANNMQNAFLGQEGVNMLDAWLNADSQAPMVPPYVMATATWGDVCEPTEISCSDGIDNDCDGLTDGDDPDCQCTPVPEVCDDGIDNDCDGLIDGDDPDCQMTCSSYTSKETCNAAPHCQWQGSPKSGMCVDACSPTEPTEVTCNDGVDNDCDGNADCSDSDCIGTPECPAIDCSVYTTRNLCNAQPTCSWDNKIKVCLNN
jgi:hypothetical protein